MFLLLFLFFSSSFFFFWLFEFTFLDYLAVEGFLEADGLPFEDEFLPLEADFLLFDPLLEAGTGDFPLLWLPIDFLWEEATLGFD